ncbi:hypothetical protein NDU88_004069 [Pleurodeles waltl]|uniref:Uncharacterized protein n=1 Tax=Pleurodeles waltl TaxID=8319 RepID=A0AAV7L0U3_PLEWA|nr:hypothetical protein NDU88_004069 [Pleurodeles waltl]
MFYRATDDTSIIFGEEHAQEQPPVNEGEAFSINESSGSELKVDFEMKNITPAQPTETAICTTLTFSAELTPTSSAMNVPSTSNPKALQPKMLKPSSKPCPEPHVEEIWHKLQEKLDTCQEIIHI